MTTLLTEFLEEPEIAEIIGPNIQDTYLGVEWDPEELGLPMEYETPYLTSVDELTGLKVVTPRKITDSQYMVWTEAHLTCNFEVYIFKPNFPLFEDDPRLFIINPFWNKHYMLAEIDLSFDSEISLLVDILDGETPSVVGVLSITPTNFDNDRIEAPTRRRRSRP